MEGNNKQTQETSQSNGYVKIILRGIGIECDDMIGLWGVSFNAIASIDAKDAKSERKALRIMQRHFVCERNWDFTYRLYPPPPTYIDLRQFKSSDEVKQYFLSMFNNLAEDLKKHHYTVDLTLNIGDIEKLDVQKEITECERMHKEFMELEEEYSEMMEPDCTEEEVEECMNDEECRWAMENENDVYWETGMSVSPC